ACIAILGDRENVGSGLHCGIPFSFSAMRTLVHSPVAGGPGRLLRDWETALAASAVGGTGWRSRQASGISARPRVWRRRLGFLLCESLFMLLATNSSGHRAFEGHGWPLASIIKGDGPPNPLAHVEFLLTVS